MAAPDISTLPTYVYAAASAVRSLEYDLWRWSRQERTRVILAALDAIPPLPDGLEMQRGVDWSDLLGSDDEKTTTYAEAFNAAREKAIEILHERVAKREARARRHGL